LIAAKVLIGFAVYRLVRARHPRWLGMRVGFRDIDAPISKAIEKH
jgi:hypothetical protein